MNSKVLISSAMLVALAGGLCWYVFISQQESKSTAEITTSYQASPSQASSGQRSLEMSSEITGPVGARKPLDGMRTYGDVSSSLASSRIDEPQRLQYLITAAQVCESYQQNQSMSSSLARKGSESMDYYNSYFRNFCSNFSGSSIEFEKQLVAHVDSDVVIARELPELAASGLTPETSLVAETIVLTSSNPDAVYNAAAALASQNHWQLGRNIVSTPQERAALPKAQWMAAQILVCDLSGGCAEDGLRTVIECGSYSNCTPGITVKEVMRQTSTPVQYELARRIYEQLIIDREQASRLRS
jgi:hypothetical protein